MKTRSVAFSLLAGLMLAFAMFMVWRHDTILVSYSDHCKSNGIMIDAAKEMWAFDHQKTDDAIVSEDDLAPYSQNKGHWVCMSGGTISIGKIGEDPLCTVHGQLPQGLRKEQTLLFHAEP